MKEGAILIPSAGWEQVALLERARKRGLRVVAANVTRVEEAAALADEYHLVDSRDLPGLLKVARERQVTAVASDQCDYGNFAVSAIGQALGLPAIPLVSAQRSTNKRLMREACARAGNIPQPEFRPARTLDEARAAAVDLGYPLITKPVDNRGSFGVNRVDRPSDLEAAFLDSVMHAHSREVLVECFIEGVVLTVDGYAFHDGHRSLAVASRSRFAGSSVAQDIIYPAEVAAATRRRVIEVNDRVARALGIERGATHGEYIATAEGEIYLLEQANRGGGVLTASVIVPALTGWDLSDALVREALGVRPTSMELPKVPVKTAMLKFFALPVHGTVHSAGWQAPPTGLPGVLAARLLLKPRAPVPRVATGADRHGFLIVEGADRHACEAAAAQVLSLARVHAD